MTRNQQFRALFRAGSPFVCMGAFDANPDIIDIGRDLYHATRCATPNEAGMQARFALLAAL